MSSGAPRCAACGGSVRDGVLQAGEAWHSECQQAAADRVPRRITLSLDERTLRVFGTLGDGVASRGARKAADACRGVLAGAGGKAALEAAAEAGGSLP